jgi:hypothetical protein
MTDPISPETQAAIDAAMKVLDDFMRAFNAKDLEAWEDTFNFPSIRHASGKIVTITKGWHKPDMFGKGALSEWHHSAWQRRKIVHAGPNKVHIDTAFGRYRADDTLIGSFDSIYVVTLEDGHWGVKIRSSFAP